MDKGEACLADCMYLLRWVISVSVRFYEVTTQNSGVPKIFRLNRAVLLSVLLKVDLRKVLQEMKLDSMFNLLRPTPVFVFPPLVGDRGQVYWLKLVENYKITKMRGSSSSGNSSGNSSGRSSGRSSGSSFGEIELQEMGERRWDESLDDVGDVDDGYLQNIVCVGCGKIPLQDLALMDTCRHSFCKLCLDAWFRRRCVEGGV